MTAGVGLVMLGQVAVVKAVYEEQEVEVDDIEWDCPDSILRPPGSVLAGSGEGAS